MKRIVCILFLFIIMLPSSWGQGVVVIRSSAQKVAKNVLQRNIASGNLSPRALSFYKQMQRENFWELDDMLEDYFGLNPLKAPSASFVRLNKTLEEAVVDNYMKRAFYLSEHPVQYQTEVLVGKGNYVSYIPEQARVVLFGEFHEEPWIVDEVERAVYQYAKAYPEKNVYYASEFVDSQANTEPYILSTETDVVQKVRKRPFYRLVTKRIMRSGVNVVGLENPQISDVVVKQGYGKLTDNRLGWMAVSPAGMEDRNTHWASIIENILSSDPNAVVLVHAGAGHTSYNHPSSLSVKLKHYSPFVIDFTPAVWSHLNPLLSRFAPITREFYDKAADIHLQDPDAKVMFLRRFTDKRFALSVGSDIQITNFQKE